MFVVGLLVGGFRQQSSESKVVPEAGRDFFHAAYTGDVEQLDGYFKNGVSPNVKNGRTHGLTPLMYASWGGKVEAIQYLFANGADVNEVNSDGVTALMLAAYANHEEAAKVLLDNKASADLLDKKQNSALTFAITKENIAMIKLLISYGGLNQRGRMGRSPLAVATLKNKTNALRIILSLPQGRVLANRKDTTAMNPFMLAAKAGNVNLVRELLPFTDDVNSTDFKGRTAFDLLSKSAVPEGKLSALKAIRSRGARTGGPIRTNRKQEVPSQARRTPKR